MLVGRLGARRALSGLLASSFVAVGLLLPSTASWASPTTEPAPQAATVDADEIDATTVAPVDPLVSEGEDLEVTIQAATTTPRDREVSISIGTSPIVTRYALSEWLGDGGSAAQSLVGSALLPAGHATTSVTIPSEALSLSTSGAYVLSALVEGDDAAAWSFVVADRLGEIGPTSIALAGEVTAPVSASGLLDASALEAATAADGTLGTQLVLAEQHGIALGIDPIVAASVAALGDDAPSVAVDWLERATALAEAYPVPYGGGDPITYARAGVTEPMLLGLTSPDGDVVPSTDMAVPPTGTPVLDATSSSLDAELLATLDEAGTPVVSTASLDEFVEQTTPSAHATIDGVDALAVDAELQPLIDAASAQDGVGAASARASVAALLATITLEAPNLPRTLAASLTLGEGSGPLLDMLDGADWLDVVGVQDALDEPAREATLVPSEASGAEAAAVERVHAALDLDATTAPVLAAIDPADLDTVLVPERLMLLSALADASRLDGGAGIGALEESAAEIASAVTISDAGTAIIVSGNAELPVTVTNSLDVPVTVRVEAVAGNPIVHVDPAPVETEIAAETQQRVVLPVEAVGTGASELRVRILAPDGQEILAPVTVRVDAQPTVELVIIIVVVGAAVLLVGFGIIRSIRKRRRGETHGDLDPIARTDPPHDEGEDGAPGRSDADEGATPVDGAAGADDAARDGADPGGGRRAHDQEARA